MKMLFATPLCVALGVAVAAPTAQSSGPDRTTAQIAKKASKKQANRRPRGRKGPVRP
jgi:hypothetical protein